MDTHGSLGEQYGWVFSRWCSPTPEIVLFVCSLRVFSEGISPTTHVRNCPNCTLDGISEEVSDDTTQNGNFKRIQNETDTECNNSEDNRYYETVHGHRVYKTVRVYSGYGEYIRVVLLLCN